MRDLSNTSKKAIGVPFVLLYMNLAMLIIAPEAYLDLSVLIPVTILSAAICADVSIRPISAKRDQYSRSILVLAFLLFPLVIVLPYLENRYFMHAMLMQESTLILWFAGVVLLIGGSVVLIDSRMRIGRYGGPRIVIEDDHRLVREGAYRVVRHPLYASMLVIFIGYGISFAGLFSTLATFICMFSVMRSRMNLEERLLAETFGDEYRSYVKHTWRLFPYVY